ncbi:acyltransferase-domain-containing protein [Lanmaoa asiatica]|nr:acyltransferase-domain-containing protein [Lanmaoa asiatica]
MYASNDKNLAVKDVFENDEQHQIRYKTLSWQFVSLLMIAEIVSNGLLSLPNTLAVVGESSHSSASFLSSSQRHRTSSHSRRTSSSTIPNVHTMGDAGYIIFGPVGREILLVGTVIFAISEAGAELLSGQQALSTLSNGALCSMHFVLICGGITLLIALPRTLDRLTWMGLLSAATITIAGVLSMIGAGVNPLPGRVISATIPTSFENAFLSVTSPVKLSDHAFRFFILISEMKRPQDAMKAAWCLQGFATTFYAVFCIVNYAYIGNTTQSPNLFSLPPRWAKACFGIAFFNFMFAGGIYIHTVAKVIFVRFFRHSEHIHSHTMLGWTVWTLLCFIGVVIGVVLAIAVPIFSYLIGIVAALFASWYTYGLAGFFWLFDTYHLKGGMNAFRRRPIGTILAVMTILAGAFICVAGTYLIYQSYAAGTIGKPTWAQTLNGLLFLSLFIPGCFMVHGFQLLFVLPLKLVPGPISGKLYDEGIRYTKGAFAALMNLMNQWFAPTKLSITFETEGQGKFTEEEIQNVVERNASGKVIALQLPSRCVIISNHQVYSDWWYVWCLTYFARTHKDVFIVLKNSLKWVPVIGPGMQMYRFIFLARSWASDKIQLARQLSKLGKKAQEENKPFAFILFPEGTLVSENTRPVSGKYAEKMGVPDLCNILLPRSTGLHYSLRSLVPRLPTLKLLDITVIYPGIPPKGYGQSYYTLRSIFCDRVPPPVVHMHLRIFDIAKDVPIGNTPGSIVSNGSANNSAEPNLSEREKDIFDIWLRKLWSEKDDYITKFLETGTAPSKQRPVEIPLELRKRAEIAEAYCFFAPLLMACWWKRLTDWVL